MAFSTNFRSFTTSPRIVVALFVIAFGIATTTVAETPVAPASHRVVVGTIDTGIDPSHPDLMWGGHSRIYRLWDMRDTTRRNGPDHHSAVYVGSEIDTCQLIGDKEGHGTAVASVICDGVGSPDEFGADIICVCVPRNSGQSAVAAGIEYIRSIAEAERRPYLINLSVGFAGGAKDGITDTLEYAIARLFQRDSLGLLKQVICAAGNSNYDSTVVDNLHTARLSITEAVSLENRRCHARGHSPASFKMNLNTTPLLDDDSCVLELWYSASRPYTVSIQTPSQATIVSPQEPGVWAPDPSKIAQKFGYVEVTNFGQVQGPGPEPPVWASIRIVMRDDSTGYGQLMGGNWTVELMSGFGAWDAYLTAVGPAECKKAILRDQISNECNLDIGANVPASITVGAFNPYDSCSWMSPSGDPVTLDAGYPKNSISHFSSRGPTRSGFGKPDLYAAGQCCTVALSRQMSEDLVTQIDNSNLRAGDELHFISQGTSFAAPQVTRTVVKMLNERPCLRPDEIKHLLITSGDHVYDGQKLCFLLNADKALKLTRQQDCK